MTPRHLDIALSELVVDLRWAPLTHLMTLLSAWWVKDLAGVVVVGWADVRRRHLSADALLVALATAIAGGVGNVLKALFDRPRPFAQGLWDGLGRLPASSSMPSGHACTAFAAGVAVALLVPRLRVPALVLAGAICVSRVYLGVHFVSDVLVGAALGAVIALVVIRVGTALQGSHRLQGT